MDLEEAKTVNRARFELEVRTNMSFCCRYSVHLYTHCAIAGVCAVTCKSLLSAFTCPTKLLGGHCVHQLPPISFILEGKGLCPLCSVCFLACVYALDVSMFQLSTCPSPSRTPSTSQFPCRHEKGRVLPRISAPETVRSLEDLVSNEVPGVQASSHSYRRDPAFMPKKET